MGQTGGFQYLNAKNQEGLVMKPKAIVITGYGINCDYETEHALKWAGFDARRAHLEEIIRKKDSLDNASLLAIPGGFSFGDDLGSGKVLGNKIRFNMKGKIDRFIETGLVVGICNGFQVLAKMGLLPKPDWNQKITLTFNDSGKFEDRWVDLKVPESRCVFTQGIEKMRLPVRHGEGKIVTDVKTLSDIERNGQIALQYAIGNTSTQKYPYNPNGSPLGIAGICDPSGRVFGLMPHPEAFNHPLNDPCRSGELGLKIFRNAFAFCSQ